MDSARQCHETHFEPSLPELKYTHDLAITIHDMASTIHDVASTIHSHPTRRITRLISSCHGPSLVGSVVTPNSSTTRRSGAR
jgi:hypothetical protein